MIDSKQTLVADLLRLAMKGLAFLIICLGIYLLLLFTLTHIKVTGNPLIYRASQGLVPKGGFTYARFKDYDPKVKYDILAFGSSRVNRGINPRVFEDAGYTIYNLGTDNQTPVNTELLVKQYVKPGHCKLVIMDVYDKIFSRSSLESAADLIQNLNDDKLAFRMTVANMDFRTINLLGIRMMLKNTSPNFMGDTKLYKGYRFKADEKNDFSGDKYIYKTNKKNLQEFEAAIKYLQSINVAVLVVCQPMPHYNINNDNQKKLLDDLQPILAATNTQLHDFSNDTTIVALEDFADESHLTMHGAELYSQYLIDNLVSKMIQPE